MKAIENITKVVKMIVWMLMGIACLISIVCPILSFGWIKTLPSGHIFPSNED